MKKVAIFLTLLICVVLTSCAEEKQIDYSSLVISREVLVSPYKEAFECRSFQGTTYYQYSPEINDNSKHPLVIAFHGASGAITAVRDFGAPLISKESQTALGNAYVVVPINPEGNFSDTNFYTELIENVMKENADIDPKRVYVIGHSQGAGFSFQLLLNKPELFTAACLSCNFYKLSQDEAEKLKNIHFWLVTSTNDYPEFYQNTLNAYDKLNKVNADILYIEFHDRGHAKADINEKIDKYDTDAINWISQKTKE